MREDYQTQEISVEMQKQKAFYRLLNTFYRSSRNRFSDLKENVGDIWDMVANEDAIHTRLKNLANKGLGSISSENLFDMSLICCILWNNIPDSNEQPSGADNTVTTPENVDYVFTVADFGFSDPDGDSLLGVEILTIPELGILKKNGVAMEANDSIAANGIAAGNLTFTPGAGEFGVSYASFTFIVGDDGGTDHGGVNVGAPNTMTIDVIEEV